MKTDKSSISIIDLIMIGFGCLLYAFSIVFFNINNNLADGGLNGISLILKALFQINPSYSTIFLNIPLILIGFYFLDKQSLIYTFYGIFMLSLFLWVWQKIPFNINIHHDLFLASIAAGLCGGTGSGLLYRFGGTTGGTDIIARILGSLKGIPMGKTLLWIDVGVLFASLVYVDVRHMAYTLLYAYIFSKLVNFIINGSYAAKVVLIISDKYQSIAQEITKQIGRDATVISSKGAYSHKLRNTLYVVADKSEIHELTNIITKFDSHAFVTISDANEVIGEGFSYQRPKPKFLKKLNL